MPIEIPITPPPIKRRISTLEIMQGVIIPPIQRVELMSEDEYEEYTMEWVADYLFPKYARVRAFGGAGDKGRDVVGYYSDSSIDIYQCKHYNDKISPTNIYPELGKLCYYTFNQFYAVPKTYYIVAPKGCGSTVLDLIDNPDRINQALIDNWKRYCEGGITSKEKIELKGALEKYVEGFDFSIVHDIAPHEMLEQHRQTKHHIVRFGGGIKKYRNTIPAADSEIQTRELRYTTMLFEVYAEKLSKNINDVNSLKSVDDNLHKHFETQRNSFYSAESLEKFSRENFPDSDPMPFDELKDESHNVLTTTLELHADKMGYERLLLASQEIKRQGFLSNPLSNEMKALDKDGLCHHLANDGRLKWIEK